MCARKVLGDLGERAIVERLIVDRFESVKNNFDDAAVIGQQEISGDLVVTTDACPTPAAFSVLGADMKLFGDMTVLINISDLAAMGARPLGILISSVMPEDMDVREYEEFLSGVKRTCEKYVCPLIGGNIKDGREFSSTGTALGVVPRGKALKRSCARDGDRICVIGRMGLFWSAIAAGQYGVAVPEEEAADLRRALTQPEAKLREGQFLSSGGYASACMDSSDSIFTCLREISIASGVQMVVERRLLKPEPVVERVAGAVGGQVENYMFSWGDWQLVCTVREKNVDAVRRELEAMGQAFAVIGRVVSGKPAVLVEEGANMRPLSMELSSERFSGVPMLSDGGKVYLEKLKRAAF